MAFAVVVAAILAFRFYGGDGLPFDRADVTELRFRYSYHDTTEVVVDDYEQVQQIMRTLKVRPHAKTLCAHNAEVVLTINGSKHGASVCGKCFNMGGEFHGYFEMPSEFAELMLAYRDSTRLKRAWDGLSGF